MSELSLPPPNLRVRKAGKPIITRKWLNDDVDLTAFIQVQEYSLKMSDCSRTIELDFGMWSESEEELHKSYEAATKKLQRIVSACASLRDNLEIEKARQSERIKKAKEMKGKKI